MSSRSTTRRFHAGLSGCGLHRRRTTADIEHLVRALAEIWAEVGLANVGDPIFRLSGWDGDLVDRCLKSGWKTAIKPSND